MTDPLYGTSGTENGQGGAEGKPPPNEKSAEPALPRPETPVIPDAEAMKVLRQAARDVRILVSYLARRDCAKFQALRQRVDLNPCVADRIAHGEYSKELELALWDQLSALSQEAKPASAESIADSNYYATVFGEANPQRSRGAWVLRGIRINAFFVLVITLLLGIYVTLTDSQISALRADIAQREQIILAEGDGVTAADEGSESAPLTESETRDAADRRSLEEVEGEIANGYALIWPIMVLTGADMTSGVLHVGNRQYDLFNKVVLDVQHNVNRIIDNYLVPMLAAFLGVAVFIVRDTNERLDSVSLSPMEADGYWPRVLLGLIAGLSIGWLTTPIVQGGAPANPGVDLTGTFANLSKAAIAFIVGYSIEVLFNILDAFKTALGAKPTAAPETTNKDGG